MPKRIAVHRERIPAALGSRFYKVRHAVYVDGALFGSISSISATPGSWRVQLFDPELVSGDFYGMPEARAWALEMAERKLDPARGPIATHRDRYGYEERIEEVTGAWEGKR